MKQVSVTKAYETRKTSTLRPVVQRRDKEQVHAGARNTFYEKKGTIFAEGWEKKAPLQARALSSWMKREKTGEIQQQGTGFTVIVFIGAP